MTTLSTTARLAIVTTLCQSILWAADSSPLSSETAEPPSISALKTAFADHFLMGAALNTKNFTEKDAAKSALIKKHFNSITPENALKWGPIHPELDKYNFDQADRYVEFGVKNQMFTIGHTLLWHQQTPDWVFQDAKGKPLDRDALLERMRDHIQKVVGRYKGKINGWDVVNEALNDDGSLRQTQWLKIIGPDYIEKAFVFAHAADPEAELYYNDYSLELHAKRDAAVALVKKLQAAGIHISGIGSQTHAGLDRPSVQEVEDSLIAFGQLGVKVMITELDISLLPNATQNQGADVSARATYDDALNPYPDSLPQEMQEKLAARYADLFAVYIKHADKIDRVTFWGVTDGESWLNNWPVRGRVNYPLLFDRANQPKPAFHAVIRVATESKRAAQPK